MLIRNVNDLKAHLGRAINKATSDEFLLPYVQLAQDEFIRPAIGAAMLTELDTQYNAVDGNALTAENKILLEWLQRPLAWYAYWKYLPFSIGNDGDNGLQEQGTDKTQPVRIGVLDKRLRESIENASTALENALAYLDFHKASYSTWTASDDYKAARSLFLYSATQLGEHLPQSKGSYRLLLTLKPYLRLSEQETILPLIGQALFDELKTQLTPATQPKPVQALLHRIRNAVAADAYARALFHLNVVQTSGGSLRILSDFDGIYNEKAPSDDVLHEARSQAGAEAANYLKTLKTYLTNHADDYPAYKASDRFAAKNPYDLPNNEQYVGIFRMR